VPSKFTSKTPWREKLERHEAKIVDIPPRMQVRLGIGRMVIPKPLDVDKLIRQVPKGKLVTGPVLCQELARRSNVEVACPITTGIFVRICSEASEEERHAGKKMVTPYWRVLNSEGALNPKFPGGIAGQKRKLTAEGHTIAPGRGKKPPVVADFKKSLVRF
jgi:hypothetical protein